MNLVAVLSTATLPELNAQLLALAQFALVLATFASLLFSLAAARAYSWTLMARRAGLAAPSGSGALLTLALLCAALCLRLCALAA